MASGFRASRNSCCSPLPPLPPPPTAPRSGCFSGCAASAGSCGPCCAGGSRLPGLMQGSLTIVAGAAMLLAANFALSGQLAWTPGGDGVAFGRMLQDGIVARYLQGSLPAAELQALPLSQRTAAHRRRLPVGQQHVRHARPLRRAERRDGLSSRCIRSPNIRSGRPRRRIVATASNWCTWRPAKAAAAGSRTPTASSSATSPRRSSRCARRISSIGDLDFTAINRIHVPVALASMLAGVRPVRPRRLAAPARRSHACSPRRCRFALLGNAVICGVISGPHDRYGARMVWIATFTVLIAAIRHFAGDDEPADDSLPR